MSHCLSFLYTSLFSQLIFILSIYIIALVCFLIVDIRSTRLPLIKPTSSNKLCMHACMHVTIIINYCISLQKTPKQWESKYSNHSCRKTTNHSRHCVVETTWSTLRVMTMWRQVILLILIGFHKLYCISLQKTPKQWVSECAHHSCRTTTNHNRHSAFPLYSWNGVIYTTNYDIVKKVQKQSSTPLHIKMLFPELRKDGV